MYALVDCNNFYCSCEKVFNPGLEGQPVIVLSNNDGCAISRSQEARNLGIAMASPAFMMKNLIEEHRVAVFSSNYTLYGDMSSRIMGTLAFFVPKIELYSIDEAFLELSEMTHVNLLDLRFRIRSTIRKNIGIPVSIGISIEFLEEDLSAERYKEILQFEMPEEKMGTITVYTIRSGKPRPDGKAKNEYWEWEKLLEAEA